MGEIGFRDLKGKYRRFPSAVRPASEFLREGFHGIHRAAELVREGSRGIYSAGKALREGLIPRHLRQGDRVSRFSKRRLGMLGRAGFGSEFLRGSFHSEGSAAGVVREGLIPGHLREGDRVSRLI